MENKKKSYCYFEWNLLLELQYFLRQLLLQYFVTGVQLKKNKLEKVMQI